MEITTCAGCGTRVIPAPEGICPSCGRSVTGAAAAPVVSTATQEPLNPYQPLSLSQPTDGELDLLIAKRQRGIRTSFWFMAIAGVASFAMIFLTGFIWFANLLAIAFVSGLIGFIVDSRAVAKLRRQRAEAVEPRL